MKSDTKDHNANDQLKEIGTWLIPELARMDHDPILPDEIAAKASSALGRTITTGDLFHVTLKSLISHVVDHAATVAFFRHDRIGYVHKTPKLLLDYEQEMAEIADMESTALQIRFKDATKEANRLKGKLADQLTKSWIDAWFELAFHEDARDQARNALAVKGVMPAEIDARDQIATSHGLSMRWRCSCCGEDV